jgi:hypothetical protein
MTEYHIEREAYLAVVNAIARRWNLEPDDVKIAMGEGGNIWPASIRENVALEQRKKIKNCVC